MNPPGWPTRLLIVPSFVSRAVASSANYPETASASAPHSPFVLHSPFVSAASWRFTPPSLAQRTAHHAYSRIQSHSHFEVQALQSSIASRSSSPPVLAFHRVASCMFVLQVETANGRRQWPAVGGWQVMRCPMNHVRCSVATWSSIRHAHLLVAPFYPFDDLVASRSPGAAAVGQHKGWTAEVQAAEQTAICPFGNS